MFAIAQHTSFRIGLAAVNALDLRLYRITGELITDIAMSANPAIIWMDQFAKLCKESRGKPSAKCFKNLLHMKKLDF